MENETKPAGVRASANFKCIYCGWVGGVNPSDPICGNSRCVEPYPGKDVSGVALPATAEPVAWRYRTPLNGGWGGWQHCGHEPGGENSDTFQKEPLYAAGVGGDAMEQSLSLYVEQAEAIRELLDKHAPDTTGNLQTRLAQVFASGVALPDGGQQG